MTDEQDETRTQDRASYALDALWWLTEARQTSGDQALISALIGIGNAILASGHEIDWDVVDQLREVRRAP